MKKVFLSSIIVIILTNFIFCNISYASGLKSDKAEDIMETVEDMSENGTVNTNGSTMDITSATNSTVLWAPLGFLVSLINVFPFTSHALASLMLSNIGIIETNVSDDDYILFNIQNIITGKYVFLDANIFRDLQKEANLEDTNPIVILRKNITLWFVIVRDIAIVTNLGILVYISIQMAVNTISKGRAKYKEMLYNWAVSMVIIFFLPYIMVLICNISEILVDFVREMMDSMEMDSFETSVMELLLTNVFTSTPTDMLFYSLLYWIMIWNEIKFLVSYSKRMLTSYFLVIISPFITVTYSIDKLGDNKAQAFTKWIKEFSLNMFIQPIHCIVYLVFMFMANNIAARAPLIGIMFLMSLSRAEKIIISIFGLSANSLKQAGDNVSIKGLTGKLKGLVPKGMMPGAPKGG